MINPPALRQWHKVIASKYSGKPCNFCATPTIVGEAYAAIRNRNGAWQTICATCANDPIAMVKGLVLSLSAKAEKLDSAAVAALASQLPTNLGDVLAGTASAADVQDVLNTLLTVQVNANAADPLITALSAVVNDPARSKDKAFAASLLSQMLSGKTLSDKQMACAERMVAPVVVSAPQADLVDGSIHDVNGVLYQVVRGKTGHQYAMMLASEPVAGRKLDWVFVKGALATVRRSGTPVTAEVAAMIGKLTTYCCFCHRHLSDDGENRSLDVGYGPKCASKHGLPWG